MKIVIDDKIPFIKGVFEKYAETVYLPGAKFDASSVADADALIVRTRTKCNASLLDGSRVRFIATATIGFDHVNPEYCASHGITWTSAPGCNSSSVQQYVASVLLRHGAKHNVQLKGKTIGIVGVGNVGKKVAVLAAKLGMKVLLNDPPRERAERSRDFVPLETICREADFITMHVPLTRDGADRTFHLCDEKFFNSLARKPFFINASRGEVVNGEALKSAIITGLVCGGALDVWENEPDVDAELISLLEFATPHIAGYSCDGKVNGTTMSVRAAAKFFGIKALEDFVPTGVPEPEDPVIVLNDDKTALLDAVTRTYDVLSDDARLRASPETFEAQRGSYPLRREFPSYTISEKSLISDRTKELLASLGFNVGK